MAVSKNLQEKALEFIKTSFSKYSNRSGLEDKWREADQLFNNITTEKFYNGAANLFSPETRSACKTLINTVEEILFNNNSNLFRVDGVGGGNDVKKANIITKKIKSDMAKTHFRDKVRSLLEPLVKYGFVIAKVPFSVKEKFIIKDITERKKLKKNILKMFGMKIAKFLDKDFDKAEKKRILSFYGTELEVKEIHSMYWDYFKKWEDQNCIIERKIVNWNHLKANELRVNADGEPQGIYINLDKVKALAETKDQSADDEKNIITEKFDHITDITGLSGSFNTEKKRFELLEGWCNFDLDGDGIDEECVISVINREIVVRLEPNNFDNQEKPYLNCPWETIEGTSLGIGVPQLAKSSQIALNDFVNQIMDNITFILNNMWIVDEMAEIPSAQLKSRPNGVIKSKTGVDGVKAVEKQLTATEGFKAVAMAKEDIRQVSSATVSLQGMQAKYGTSATESSQMATASLRDVLAKVRALEDKIIKPWLKRDYEDTMQFNTREDLIKIVGREAAVAVLPEDKDIRESLRADIDFIWNGATQVENKIVAVQQLLNMYNIAVKSPAGIWNVHALAKKLWAKTGDGDDTVVLDPPQQSLIHPDDEAILIAQGEEVHAKPMENHHQHIMAHMQALQEMAPNVAERMKEHIQEHSMMAEQLMLAQAQQQGIEGEPGVPAQEQPRARPDTMTEGNIGRDTNAPVSGETL